MSVSAAIPPQNLEAEESVLGAFMISGAPDSALFDKVEETGLRAEDFYRDSHARIYRAALALHAAGDVVDAITLTDELERRRELDDVGGRVRIHELSLIVPASANAPHYARIVVEAAVRRAAIRAGGELAQLGWEHETDSSGLVLRAQELVEALAERSALGDDLTPLWWQQAIREPIPATSEYVDGVLQAGVLADIVGLPYLHKTALALELATKVSRGTGKLLGRFDITAQAHTAYFWSDDSRAKELERIQAYAKACQHDVVPLAFYLNTGLVLPDGIPLLKAQIRRHGFRLIVLDSLYNFAPGLDWIKDHAGVSLLYHQLKRLCDQTEGLTIILVDHASKPSDSNKGRDASVSSFGTVWKAAAVRSSIVITKDAHGLKATAIGNNIKGFPATPIAFDDELLELRVVDVKDPSEDTEKIDAEVLAEVKRLPGLSGNQVRVNVRRGKAKVAASLARLEAANLIYNTYAAGTELFQGKPGQADRGAYSEPAPDETRASRGKSPKSAWFPVKQAETLAPPPNGGKPGEAAPGTVTGVVSATCPEPAPLRSRGQEGAIATPETDYLESLAPDPSAPSDDIDWGTP